MDNKSIKLTLSFLTICLVICSGLTSMAFGYDDDIVNEESTSLGRSFGKTISELVDSSMDSPWPMKCHDVRHTGCSPFSAANNSGVEKWRFRVISSIDEGIVIDRNETLYAAALNLNAVYPNGTLKWIFDPDGYCTSVPAIAKDGTIYIGTFHGRFYAVNPDGTQKWKFTPPGTGNSITSSPAIANDGTIYFGLMGGYQVYALNPNGSVKWDYKTGYHICSSPAIGEDGTIYIGSSDQYLYALNPNGTLRWRYKTGGWVKSSPSIAYDGTIYFGSYDGHLYALYPNGTVKWRFNNPGSGNEAATIGTDGIVYIIGKKLFALNPEDGSIKWRYDFEGGTAVCSPAIDSEGIIYVSIGKTFYAFNPDGTLRWEYSVPFPNGKAGELSTSPCIGSDGTVYICSTVDEYIEPGAVKNVGYIHAFGSGNEKKVSMTRPIEEHLYWFNAEKGVTRRGNTVVIGDLDVTANVTQPQKVEEVLFQLKGRTSWKSFKDYTSPYEWYLDDRVPLFIPYCHNFLFDLEVRAYYEGGFEYHDVRHGCVWSEEITIIYIHPW